MTVLARILFDTGIFNVLSSAGALGAGWKLNWYLEDSSTRIDTYVGELVATKNANPVVADANGRFSQIWIEADQRLKYVLTDADGTVKVTVNGYVAAAVPPDIDASLEDFVAGISALPVANGGTGSTSAANARTALAVLGTAGGTMTGNITRSGKGIHPYFNNSSMTGGQIYIQAAGADPTSNPGDIVFEY